MTEHAPIQIVEQKKNRRRGAIWASAGLGLALVVGATLATYTDSEWLKVDGGLGTGENDAINLQIGDDDLDFDSAVPTDMTGLAWQDTSRDGKTPDGQTEWGLTITQPLNFPGTADLMPGWSAKKTVYLRNSEKAPLDLFFQLVLNQCDTQTNYVFKHLKYSLDIQRAIPKTDGPNDFDHWTVVKTITATRPPSACVTGKDQTSEVSALSWKLDAGEQNFLPGSNGVDGKAGGTDDGHFGVLKVTITLTFDPAFNSASDAAFGQDWQDYLANQEDLDVFMQFGANKHATSA
jgi:predicted ribosomally synthesized peptide with SipW-like signal peptide